MKKFSLELPKYRLQLHMRLVRRRKPLISEPIIPSVKTVNRKYRKGTLVGKVARHFSEHKLTGKVVAANLTVFAFATAFIPSARASSNLPTDEPVIQVQNPIDTQKGIQFPLQSYGLSQGFSYYHPGIDMTDPVGTPVKPIKTGVVTFAGFTKDGYGNNIIIDNGKGIESLYAHLSKIEVKVGQIVDMNTEIAKVGITGHTTGPHLHLEIRENGRALNPLTVLSRK